MDLKPLSYDEVLDKSMEYMDKVWIIRNGLLVRDVEDGTTMVVDGETPEDKSGKFIRKDIWDGAMKSRAKVLKDYGATHPVEGDTASKTDWEYGYISGKLAAFREVLGEGEDVLDT